MEQTRWPKIRIVIEHAANRTQTIPIHNMCALIKDGKVTLNAKIGASRSSQFSLVEHNQMWDPKSRTRGRKAAKR